METVLLLAAKSLLAFATKSDLGVLLSLQRQLDVRFTPKSGDSACHVRHWYKADISAH